MADKNCEKIHYIAPNIYCCGAGTAADCEAVTCRWSRHSAFAAAAARWTHMRPDLYSPLAAMVSAQLELHRYATGRQSRLITSVTLLKQHLFK